MANERVIAELVAQGAQKFIQDFADSANAVSKLQTTLESTNRINTRQLNSSIVDIARSIDQLSKDGVKDLNDVIKKFDELINVISNAGRRVRTPQLRGIAQDLQGALGEVGAARNRAQIASTRVGTLDPTIRLQQQQLQAVAAAQLAAQRAAEAHANTLRGRLQTALTGVATATRNVVSSQTTYLNTLRGLRTGNIQVAQATNQNAAALTNQSSAQGNASKQGITYLSTLSAIHAASFLATGRTFTLIGSFFTLGAAFSRLGPLAVGVGLAFGALLGVFNAISKGIQILQQAFITLATTLTRVVAIAGAAGVAAATAGVKIAADVEESLALVQALERPTRAALQALEEQITSLSLKFGIAAKDVAEAASLFVRAGGGIEDALNGALQAVIELQIASAGELQAATAARTVAVGLRAFSKDGVTAAQVADAVTRAAQGSALSFTEVNQAFQQAVPGAITLGLTLNELTAVIATLGNNALRGTVAGTAFKQFLLDLINPSSSAAKTMEELGINIADADNKIRPLRDILTDLSAALKDYEAAGGAAASATKAQAIANIFGSRAALSANIIIRESVEALDDFNEKTRETTAANVAQTLLLPLNAQFRILQNNVKEAARAFGAPLLTPITTAISSAKEFIASLIPVATLAGQAVGVILSGQGFGALQEKITELTNSRVALFFTELINVGRNLADVIINQIVPAIHDFIDTITSGTDAPGRLTAIANGFATINRVIQFVGAAVAVAIRNLATLIVEFVNAEGSGGQLRDTLNVLATKTLASLIAGFVTLAPAIAAAVTVMPILARASIFAAQVVIRLVGVFKELELKLIDVSALGAKAALGLQIPDAVASGNVEQLDRIKRGIQLVEEVTAGMRERTARAFDFQGISDELDDFGSRVDSLESSITAFAARAAHDSQNFVRSFEETAGELSDILSSITAAVEQAQADAGGIRPGGTQPGPIVGEVDEKEVERVKERILEAGRDISRRLDNLAEDTTTKITNIVAKAFEKLGDINEKLQIALDKLKRETEEKIEDLKDAVEQRRDDRFRTDIERRQQDRRLQIIERSLEKQTEFEERQLEETRIARQRAVEDVQRSYDLQADAVERSYSRQQAAAEAAFQAQQKAQEQALQATQSAEEKALQRQLDAASRARQESQQRAEAKTPEDKAKVEQQIARARSDRRFEEGQQSQIDALQRRHESQRTQLQERQAAQQKAFQIGQEDAALQERLKREAKALRFRRGLENEERRIRLQEEDAQLIRRQNNEAVLDGIKRTLAQEFQKFQDGLEDEATRRQITRIRREEAERRGDLTTEANRQRGEVVDQVTQQLEEVNQAVDREIRNAIDRLRDLEDSLTPDIAAAVRGALLGVQQAALTRSRELLEGTQLQSEQARATVGAQLEVTQPSQVATLVATTLQVANLTLPQGFVNGITQGMFLALQEADRRGFFDSDIPQLNQLIQELRAPSPLPTRR